LLKGARDCDLQWSKYRPETTRTEIYAGFGWVSQNLGTGRMAQKQPAKNNKQKTSKRNNVTFRISPALLSHLIIDEST